ncbi:MAG TPA: hypothetical protein VE262_09485 [Blastocatellia bacterium]|nr:hypothetical protein [Blastocatellia bacterium]
MSKNLKILLAVIAAFSAISILHIWLNIGFDKLGFGGQSNGQAILQVGFLPVT